MTSSLYFVVNVEHCELDLNEVFDGDDPKMSMRDEWSLHRSGTYPDRYRDVDDYLNDGSMNNDEHT